MFYYLWYLLHDKNPDGSVIKCTDTFCGYCNPMFKEEQRVWRCWFRRFSRKAP